MEVQILSSAAKQAREFQPPEAIKDRAGSGCAGAKSSRNISELNYEGGQRPDRRGGGATPPPLKRQVADRVREKDHDKNQTGD